MTRGGRGLPYQTPVSQWYNFSTSVDAGHMLVVAIPKYRIERCSRKPCTWILDATVSLDGVVAVLAVGRENHHHHASVGAYVVLECTDDSLSVVVLHRDTASQTHNNVHCCVRWTVTMSTATPHRTYTKRVFSRIGALMTRTLRGATVAQRIRSSRCSK